MKLLPNNDSRLHKVSVPVKSFDGKLKNLVEQMNKEMSRTNGVGIAAPQLGVNKRVILIGVKVADNAPSTLVMVNPEITEAAGLQRSTEGCLSCPGVVVTVNRPLVISVTYQTLKGEHRAAVIKDFAAAVICHEIDHLEGILISDLEETLGI